MKEEYENTSLYKAIFEAVEKVLTPYFQRSSKNYLNIINLQNVPEDELRKHYIDYTLNHLADGYGSPISKLAEELTYAYAKKTANADRVVLEMSVKYGLSKKWQITKKIAENNVPIILAIANIGQNSLLIESDFTNAGYFLGHSREETVCGMKWKILQFEPLYQEDKTNDIRENNIAYHWSPIYNEPYILKNGFIPSSNNHLFSYPPRIYFMTGKCTNSELIGIGKALCEANKEKRNNGEYTLFFIDTSEIPEDAKFYYDPNMHNAMYTYDALPPSVILKSKHFSLR